MNRLQNKGFYLTWEDLMKKIVIALVIIMLASMVPAGLAFAEGEDVTDFRYALEYVYADGKMLIRCDAVNGYSPWTFNQEIVFSDWLSVGGWLANDEGNKKMQYTIDGGDTWNDCEKQKFSKRGDLLNAGVEFEAGHDTAGFGPGNNTIPASAITEDNVELTLRIVTLEGNYIEFATFSDVSVEEKGDDYVEEIAFLTFLDDLPDGYFELRQGDNQPCTATAELDAGVPIQLRGWAISNYGISKIVYTIDGGEYIDDATGPYVRRPDVLNAYPIYTAKQGNTKNVGIGSESNFMTLPKTGELEAGFYDVDVYAVTADGQQYYNIFKIVLVVDGGGELPTVAPTEVPTEVPTTEATEEPVVTEEPTKEPDKETNPTEAPEVTDAPKATEEPKDDGCGGTGISVFSLAAVPVALAFLKKKKD